MGKLETFLVYRFWKLVKKQKQRSQKVVYVFQLIKWIRKQRFSKKLVLTWNVLGITWGCRWHSDSFLLRGKPARASMHYIRTLSCPTNASLPGNNQTADFPVALHTDMIVMQVRVGFRFHVREYHLKNESWLVKLEGTTRRENMLVRKQFVLSLGEMNGTRPTQQRSSRQTWALSQRWNLDGFLLRR